MLNRRNEPWSTATQQISPVSTPLAVPICSAVRRPNRRANTPIGRVPAHVPSARKLIGSVANPLSGASMMPTMPAVATSTELLPPASACVTASTSALRFARRSPSATVSTGSAGANIRILRKGIREEGLVLLAADTGIIHFPTRRIW